MRDPARREAGGQEQRGRWPVRMFRLGTEPGEDLTATTTPEERLAMMWPLALEAYALARRPLPRYARAQAPVSIRPLAGLP